MVYTSGVLPIDPSHLVALNVLLQERNVTLAAKRLGITQSSMSHRLALLRAQLGDPLLVREGSRLIATPRADAITLPLARALEQLEQAVSQEHAFKPELAEGTLDLIVPDLLSAVVPELVRTLSLAAPGVLLRVRNIERNLSDGLARDERSLAMAPVSFVKDPIRCRALGELEFAVAARRGHPAFQGKLTTKKWLAYGHVVVRVGNESGNPVEQALAERGLQRRTSLQVPMFLAGLLAVAHSDLLMNVPLPVAANATRTLGLVVKRAPLELPRVRFVTAWHARFDSDPMHTWLREQLHRAVSALLLNSK